MILKSKRYNNNNCCPQLQPIKQLNIYFTLLHIYYMLILNYFMAKTSNSIRASGTHSASKQVAILNVTYTPQCASNKKLCKRRNSSAMTTLSAVTVSKAISSKYSSRITCQGLNDNNNNNKYEHRKQDTASAYKILATLQKRFIHIFVYIKWLIFENIANYFISMQIEATKIATTQRLPIANTANTTCTASAVDTHNYSNSAMTGNIHHTFNTTRRRTCSATSTSAANSKKGSVSRSSKVNGNATITVKTICSSSTRQRLNNENCNELVYEKRKRRCGVIALLYYMLVNIKWLAFRYIANCNKSIHRATKVNTHHTFNTSNEICSENAKTNLNTKTRTTTNALKTTTTISGTIAAIKIYTKAKKSRRRRRGISLSNNSSWCCCWCWRRCYIILSSYALNFNSMRYALNTTQRINASRLKGISYIRLISFKVKRFLQIPYKSKQSTNFIYERLKNCLSSIKPHAYGLSTTMKTCLLHLLRARVFGVTLRKEATIITQQSSKLAPLLQHNGHPEPPVMQITPVHSTQSQQPQTASTPSHTIAPLRAMQMHPQAQSQSPQLSLIPQPSPQLLLPSQVQQPQAHHMLQQRSLHLLLHTCCGFLQCIMTALVKSVSLAHLRQSFAIGDRRCFHWHYQPLSLLQRSFTVLVLLSSLWHGTECFHGSVKLTANTVKTKYGLLRGIVVRSSPLVEAYLGIPYASPPIGSLRFMPPITPSTWKTVRNADRFSAVCPQTVPIPPNGPEALLEVPRARLAQLRRLLPLLSNQSEDCLYLNIYVPYENRRKRRSTSTSSMEHIHDPPSSILATVLLIHGESYEWNSGNPYDGSELAAHGNIIVVTINFRLGIFGFLKTGGKESAQGNFGLMDLVAGLHWLKENLPAFGGDPQRITLLGHSTGAALANILMVSPVASDLVQRAVLVSGSALSPWAIQRNPLFVKRRVAEQTGCHGDMLYDDLAPCLRTKSVAELLTVKIDHPRFLNGFAPFVDGTVISPNTDPVGELTLPLGAAIVSTSGIEFANFPKRDLIFCLTSVESYLDLSAQDLEFGFNETRRDRILRTFVRNNFHYHLNEIFAVLKNEYTDWEKAIRSPLSSRDATLSFLSDGHTAAGLIKLGYMHSLRGGRSYFLHFKHRTVEEEYPQRTGSVRGEDVPFWLGLPISPLFPHNYTTQEKQISRLMLRYLANFAKTGNPNQSGLDTPFMAASASRSPQLDYSKVKRASLKSLNAVNKYFNLTTSHLLTTPQHDNAVDAPAAINLALFYNQRRSLLRDRRAYYRRHLRSNSESNEEKMSNPNEPSYMERLPFWDAYDVVNQLYLELGNKAEVQSHYRGHKLSMWLNLIPQLHKHSNINDQSMRHHQFPEDISNRDLYEGVVRPQMQTKPTDDEDTAVVKLSKSPTKVVSNNTKTGDGNAAVSTATTECNTDGTAYANVGDNTSTQQPVLSKSDNRSAVVEGGVKGVGTSGGGGGQQKDLATASTGLIGNLEMFRRFNGKQFSDYTTVLVATIAVGCFLLALNILIFAGIYHQREKRARDAKTKEELQDTDTSKNSSILKLNALAGAGTADDDGLVHFDGITGKTTVLFGEYNYYDEKPKSVGGGVKEKLLVDLTPAAHTTTAHLELNWPGGVGSTSTLDLLPTKHHHAHSTSVEMPMFGGSRGNLSDIQCLQGIGVGGGVEMATYSGAYPVSCAPGLTVLESVAMPGRRSSFAAIPSGSQTSMQFDYAVQSSDQLSFKDIEAAVKASSDDLDRDIMEDDDIPEPPPPPRSFQSVHHQQQQQSQTQQHQPQQQSGILRPSGSSTVSSTSGKKRVHIQEISV